MRATLIGLCVAVTGAAWASGMQTSSSGNRMGRIMTSVNDRLGTQADAWFEDGEFPRALQLLRVHYELMPNDYEVATNLGWMLENMELFDEALAVYVRYKNENPKDPDATFPEANFYYMKKLYAKVPALLEPSISRKPHGNSYRILAHSYERLNMFKDSVRIWDVYIRLNPNDEAARNNRKRVASKITASAK